MVSLNKALFTPYSWGGAARIPLKNSEKKPPTPRKDGFGTSKAKLFGIHTRFRTFGVVGTPIPTGLRHERLGRSARATCQGTQPLQLKVIRGFYEDFSLGQAVWDGWHDAWVYIFFLVLYLHNSIYIYIYIFFLAFKPCVFFHQEPPFREQWVTMERQKGIEIRGEMSGILLLSWRCESLDMSPGSKLLLISMVRDGHDPHSTVRVYIYTYTHNQDSLLRVG